MHNHEADRKVIFIIFLYYFSHILDVTYNIYARENMPNESTLTKSIIYIVHSSALSIPYVAFISVISLYGKMFKLDWDIIRRRQQYLLIFAVFILFRITHIRKISLSLFDKLIKHSTINVNVLILIYKTHQVISLVVFAPFFEELLFRRFLYQLPKKNLKLTEVINDRDIYRFCILIFLMLENSIIFALAHYFVHKNEFFTFLFIFFTNSGLKYTLCCEIFDSILCSMFLHASENLIVVLF